jgi:splicing factor 1
MQLRELALLNGTLRETDGMRCSNCGSSEHKSWLCPDKPNVTNNIVCSACGGAGHISKDCKSKRPGLGGVEGSNNQAKIDEEYMSLMAELGEVQPQDAPTKEPQAPASKPYNIFDNPRHQPAPRPLCPPSAPPVNNSNFNPMPPMSGPPPPWTMPNSGPIAPHPMGSYPPMNQWGPPIPPIPSAFPGHPQMNQPPPPVAPPPPGKFLKLILFFVYKLQA